MQSADSGPNETAVLARGRCCGFGGQDRVAHIAKGFEDYAQRELCRQEARRDLFVVTCNLHVAKEVLTNLVGDFGCYSICMLMYAYAGQGLQVYIQSCPNASAPNSSVRYLTNISMQTCRTKVVIDALESGQNDRFLWRFDQELRTRKGPAKAVCACGRGYDSQTAERCDQHAAGDLLGVDGVSSRYAHTRHLSVRRGRAAALVDIPTQHVLLRAVADELLACLRTHSKRVDLEFSSRPPGKALL